MSLNFSVSKETRERLESLKDRAGAKSLTQVVQNALAAYELVQKAEGRITVTKEGKIEAIRLMK